VEEPVKYVVFFDLDSTLADTTHRQHLIDDARERGEEPDWEAYSLLCSGDKPFPGPVQLARMCSWDGYFIVIVSGRSEAAMKPTVEWLMEHDVPFNGIILRKQGDTTPNEEFKVNAIRNWLVNHGASWEIDKPLLIVEDWPPAARAMEAEGWTVLLFNPYPEQYVKVEHDGQVVLPSP
jgi:HAD superfamily, subfamily IIIB (Acid phosphatase)